MGECFHGVTVERVVNFTITESERIFQMERDTALRKKLNRSANPND